MFLEKRKTQWEGQLFSRHELENDPVIQQTETRGAHVYTRPISRDECVQLARHLYQIGHLDALRDLCDHPLMQQCPELLRVIAVGSVFAEFVNEA